MKNLTIIITLALLLFMKGAEAQGLGEKNVRIRITSGDLHVEAILNDTSTAQDLLKRLPLTLNLHQHQSREYYADIRLDKNDATQGGYQIGDIAYWAPGNSLVFFYDKGYTGSLIIMGKMTGNFSQLSNMGNSFKARIERIED